MLVALMMEGKFSGEGIHSLDADDDLVAAMARELVEKGGVGESADAVWAELKRERGTQLANAPQELPPTDWQDTADEWDLFSSVSTERAPAQAGPVLVLSKPKPKRVEPLWPSGHVVGEQLRLFG